MNKADEYVDDYPTCAKTYATLLVRRADGEPKDVTALLGVESIFERSVSGRGRGGTGRVNVWGLSTKGHVDSRDSRRHVDWLLAWLQGKTREVEQLQAAGWEVEISVFWHSKNGHGGPVVPPSSMKTMGELGITLGFDFYDSDPEEEAEAAPGRLEGVPR